jgi:hypothetical protein
MKIEAGKYYRTRDGRKVGPMSKDGFNGDGFPWMYELGAGWWSDTGQRLSEKSRETQDLIAEWTDAVDLTNITTPFGLLPKETQDALKAHGGPYQIWGGNDWLDGSPYWWAGTTTYRVKPQPTTDTVVLYGQNLGKEWFFCSNKDPRDHTKITLIFKDGVVQPTATVEAI